LITDGGARSLIAAILEQAYQDYTKTDACQQFCERYDMCNAKILDKDHCDARKFLHSTWAATLCDESGIDYTAYVMGMMDRCKLTKNTFKYLEGELRAYKANCRELDRLKDDIILQSPVHQEGSSSAISKPTENTVMMLMKDNRIKLLERTVKAIKQIYDRCDDGKRQLIEQVYWQNRMTMGGISDMLNRDPKTIYRWRKQIIYSLAVKLGYL
jgi:RinA family phage transcriptional activator